jgi:hypothetical protein
MFQFLRGIVFIAVMMLNCGFAVAEDMDSANFNLPNCRNSIETNRIEVATAYGTAFCSGMVRGLTYLAPDVCAPTTSTHRQVVRIIVKYIDDRPARLHESFLKLALEALQAAWPCKK